MRLLLDFFRNRRERSSVGSNRNAETGVYIEVNENFEYRNNTNHVLAIVFQRSLLSHWFLLSILCFANTGCSTTTNAVTALGKAASNTLEVAGLKKREPPPQQPALPKIATTISLKIDASQNLNVDAKGRPLSLVTKIYKLKEPTAFMQATYEMFSNSFREKEAIGSGLIDIREIVLIPNQRYESSEGLGEDTRFIGIVGLFQSPAPGYWRYVFDTKAEAKTGLMIDANACGFMVTKGTPIHKAVFAPAGEINCEKPI